MILRRSVTCATVVMLLPLVLLSCSHHEPAAAPVHSLYADNLIIGRIARPYVDTAPDDLVVSNESRNGHEGEEIRYVGAGTFAQTGDMARIAISCVEHGDIFTRKLLVNLSFSISDLNRMHQANAAISEWKTLSDTEEFPLTRSIDLIDRSGTVLIDYEDLPPDGSIHAVVSIWRTALGMNCDGSPLIIRQLVTGRLRLTRSAN